MNRKLAGAFLAVLALAPLGGLLADQAGSGSGVQQCTKFRTDSGYLFDNYETHEYSNGLLVLHLKLKTPFNDGRSWASSFTLFKPDCGFEPADFSAALPGLTYPDKMQFFSIRFTSPTHFEFWDDELEKKFTCNFGPCAGDLPRTLNNNVAYTSVSYRGAITGSEVDTDSFAIQDQNPQREPLLIIPGLMGTELGRNGKIIWPDLAAMLLDPSDSFLDILDLDPNSRPVNPDVVTGQLVSKINYGFGALDYSAGLISQFESKGYVLNKDLFVFPYDWRLGVEETSKNLQIAIQNILQSTASAKINVVAHSYGGLIFKKYLADAAQSNIDAAIFVGVPNLGSAEAAHALIFGSNLGVPLLSELEIQKLAQNMPSIYELLPSQKYFDLNPGFYDDLVDRRVKKILDYPQSKSLLTSLGKQPGLLTTSENLHFALDNLDYSSKAQRIYNIVGCGQFTLQTINKMYDQVPTLAQRFLHGPKYRVFGASGDGTVLISSAAHISGAKNYFVHAEHQKLLSMSESEQSIVNLISGQAPTTGLAEDPNGCAVQGKLISLNSSLDIQLTDAVTHQPIDLKTIKQINTGGDANLFLPTDSLQQYIVTVKPRDNTKLPVDLSVAKVQPDKTVITDYNQIMVQDKIQLALDKDSSIVSNVDQQGNSQSVLPSDTVDQSDLDTQDEAALSQDSGAQPAIQAQPQTVPTPQSIIIQYPQPVAPAALPPAGPQQPEAAPQIQGQDSDAVEEQTGLTDIPLQDSAQRAENNASLPANINITLQFPQNPLALSEQSSDGQPAISSASLQTPTPAQSSTVIIGQPEFGFWKLWTALWNLIFF